MKISQKGVVQNQIRINPKIYQKNRETTVKFDSLTHESKEIDFIGNNFLEWENISTLKRLDIDVRGASCKLKSKSKYQGSVFLVRDKLLNQNFAMKVFLNHFFNN
jgi:hypothetical protein